MDLVTCKYTLVSFSVRKILLSTGKSQICIILGSQIFLSYLTNISQESHLALTVNALDVLKCAHSLCLKYKGLFWVD